MSVSEEYNTSLWLMFSIMALLWSSKDLSGFLSWAMELLWKTKTDKKVLRLLKRDSVCSSKCMEGLISWISHIIYWQGNLGWSKFSFSNNSRGLLCWLIGPLAWDLQLMVTNDYWEVVIGKYLGKIPGCAYSTALIHWRRALSQVQWYGGHKYNGNSLR